MIENLRKARKGKGLTQTEMAVKLGYKSKSAYSMIETGKNKPRLSIALKIATILDERVEILFQELTNQSNSKKGDDISNEASKKLNKRGKRKN